MMEPEGRRSLNTDEHLVLGRMLMDRGFKDLFLHDPTRASAMLDVSLGSEGIDLIRQHLGTIEGMDPVQRGTLTTSINTVERWKQ
jgi:hypothetical protein